jgi:hypothetical protein
MVPFLSCTLTIAGAVFGLIQRVRCAEVHFAAAERDVIIAAAMRAGAHDVERGLLRPRIDNHQARIAVFVFQRPHFVGDRVNLDPVNMAEQRVDVRVAAVHVVFHDLAAKTIDAARIVIVTITDPYMTIHYGDVVWGG